MGQKHCSACGPSKAGLKFWVMSPKRRKLSFNDEGTSIGGEMAEHPHPKSLECGCVWCDGLVGLGGLLRYR